MAMAKSVVLKDVQSPERLLDETALFLHRIIADLPEGKRKMIEKLHQSPEALRGRKVLVVDDDARNIFALTTVLENQHGGLAGQLALRHALTPGSGAANASRACAAIVRNSRMDSAFNARQYSVNFTWSPAWSGCGAFTA